MMAKKGMEQPVITIIQYFIFVYIFVPRILVTNASSILLTMSSSIIFKYNRTYRDSLLATRLWELKLE